MTSSRLLLNAFVCPSPGHVKPGLWPHDLPGNELASFDELDVWVRLAATLERGCFDGLFVGDVLGLYAPYRGDWDVYVADGNRFPMLDSLTLVSALATTTRDLGLIFTASTSAEARAKRDRYDELLNDEALAAEVGGNIGIDLSALEPDQPIDYSRAQGGLGKILAEAAKHPDGVVTKRQYLRAITGDTTLVGTPGEVADALEGWRRAGGDGVNLMNYLVPGTYDDVDHLVPVLQDRGLVQRRYAPGTLREKLFGRGPHLDRRHPGARLRGAYTAPL